MKRIIYFGGSFDPIHNAHLKLAEIAYKALNANKCYFVLAKNPRWKEPSTTPKDRLNMLKLALKGHRNFKICLDEYYSDSEITYTYETMKKITEHNHNEIYYLIGSDQLQVLDKWYKIDDLCKIVKFVVFKRSNYPLNMDNMKKYHVQELIFDEIDLSSTKVRFLNNLDCPKPVLDYIAEHELYYTNILKNYISVKRLKHSFSVASLAYDIAKANKKDPYKAYHAGLIHDIAKGMNEEEASEMMKKFFPEYESKVGKWGYHQFLAVVIAKNIFKIEDEEVLEAIEFHATGKKHMSPLAKIVFCADKIDPSRGWNSKKFIKACKKDYKKGFKEVLLDNIRYFKSHNIDYKNELTLECYKYYIGEMD